MSEDEHVHNDNLDLWERVSAVADALRMCAPHQYAQASRDQFRELGQRLADLVGIGKHSGGAGIVANAIRDTLDEVGQLTDRVIRGAKHQTAGNRSLTWPGHAGILRGGHMLVGRL